MQKNTQRTEHIPPVSESRAGIILREYWNKKRSGRIFPRETDISPAEIKAIWSSCFLISIDEVTKRLGYRYSYLGEKLMEAYGDDSRDPDVTTNMLSTNSSKLISNLDEVIKNKAPVMDESEFLNAKNMKIKYRVSVFPLGTEAGEITHILGCMRWRAY